MSCSVLVKAGVWPLVAAGQPAVTSKPLTMVSVRAGVAPPPTTLRTDGLVNSRSEADPDVTGLDTLQSSTHSVGRPICDADERTGLAPSAWHNRRCCVAGMTTGQEWKERPGRWSGVLNVPRAAARLPLLPLVMESVVGTVPPNVPVPLVPCARTTPGIARTTVIDNRLTMRFIFSQVLLPEFFLQNR